MKSPTKHLTPDEIRTLWILTAVLLLGIGGRIWITSHPGAAVQGNPPEATPAASVP